MIVSGITHVYVYTCVYMIFHYIPAFIKRLGSLERQSWTHHSGNFLEKGKEKGNSRKQDEYPQRRIRLSYEICKLDLMKGRLLGGGETVHSDQHFPKCIFSNSYLWEADSYYCGATYSA